MGDSEQQFKPGDVVVTIEDERDIEVIPAGTRIKLSYQRGSDMWSGMGEINGLNRSLLVFTDNLTFDSQT